MTHMMDVLSKFSDKKHTMVDTANRLCGPHGKVQLTFAELRILNYMLDRAGNYVDRRAMLEYLWADISPRRTVDVLLCRIRKKIAATGAPLVVTTIYKYGYQCEITDGT